MVEMVVVITIIVKTADWCSLTAPQILRTAR
jgi:hypothetical protein